MMRPAMCEIQGIRKSQGESFRLEIERLAIAAGETLCVVGPTGAGKSTLLRLLTMQESPDSGCVTWLGRPVVHGAMPIETLRRIAMVHQRPLMLSRSVRYNIEYGLKVRKVKAARARTDEMIERLGLNRVADQDARTLSGGQIQLTAIGRALVVEPDLSILDEPTAHLDPANVELVEKLVQEQQRRRGTTVVWATHNLFQAKRLAHRVAFLLNGQLVEIAENSIFFGNAADRRTVDFVQGKMVY